MKIKIKLHDENPLSDVPEVISEAAKARGVSITATIAAVRNIHDNAYLCDSNIRKVRHLRNPSPSTICAMIHVLLALGVDVEIQTIAASKPVLITSTVSESIWSDLLDPEKSLSAAKKLRG